MLSKTLSFIGWSIVLFISLYFVYNNALRYFNYPAAYDENIKPFALALITHIAGGLIALLVGPLQFVNSIRRNKPYVHRLIGRIYLTTVLISALASLYLSTAHAIIKNQQLSFGAGLLGLATAWLSTSVMALLAIKKGNFVQHREWMVRSYVVTCGFVTFRVIFDLMAKQFQLDPGQVASLAAWSCWAIPLLIAEIVLQSKKLKKPSAKSSIVNLTEL